jgi:hypothetical protein
LRALRFVLPGSISGRGFKALFIFAGFTARLKQLGEKVQIEAKWAQIF